PSTRNLSPNVSPSLLAGMMIAPSVPTTITSFSPLITKPPSSQPVAVAALAGTASGSNARPAARSSATLARQSAGEMCDMFNSFLGCYPTRGGTWRGPLWITTMNLCLLRVLERTRHIACQRDSNPSISLENQGQIFVLVLLRTKKRTEGYGGFAPML